MSNISILHSYEYYKDAKSNSLCDYAEPTLVKIDKELIILWNDIAVLFFKIREQTLGNI